jgi:regulation of enolase protein 1 (concanavalin A-like superfamily)
VFEQCEWLNEPASWTLTGERLRVTTDRATDFWRETHYGFTRDSGHCYGVRTTGDFTAQVHVRGEFETLYDQAGLMVRVDATQWVKAGVEFTDGVLMLSSVLTVGQSDWATGSRIESTGGFWLRASVIQRVLRVQYSVDGAHWPLLRLAPFPHAASYFVGPMCCTPERGGLVVEFDEFRVGAPADKALHDLT